MKIIKRIKIERNIFILIINKLFLLITIKLPLNKINRGRRIDIHFCSKDQWTREYLRKQWKNQHWGEQNRWSLPNDNYIC